MRASNFLRAVLFGALLAGCGDTQGPSTFIPDDADQDAAVDNDVPEDFGMPPTFDVPVDDPPPPDVPATIDTPATTDTPAATDRVTPVDNPPPRDSAPPGMCPSSCRSDSECNPCVTPGDPGNYCCISGLCLYMTGACMPPAPDGGPPGGDGGPGDGGPGDGGDGGLGFDLGGLGDGATD